MEESERGTHLSRAYRGRAVYLNGQSAAWAPRQPQWQHWGSLPAVLTGAAGAVAGLFRSVGSAAAVFMLIAAAATVHILSGYVDA